MQETAVTCCCNKKGTKYLICCSPKGTKMALKFLKKKTTKLKTFLREYSISLYLSPCPFIINMFGIAFETDEYYVFAQEYALAGDLFDIIPPQVPHIRLDYCFSSSPQAL